LVSNLGFLVCCVEEHVFAVTFHFHYSLSLLEERHYESLIQSGLSISDLLALTYADIKYEFEHRIAPLCFDLARIKTDVSFMTFVGDWGVSLLRQHLAGKELKLQDPIFTT
jgi:hypothetical protein